MDTFVTYDDFWVWRDFPDPPDFGHPVDERHDPEEFVERIEPIEFHAIEPEHPPPTSPGVGFRAGHRAGTSDDAPGNHKPTWKGSNDA